MAEIEGVLVELSVVLGRSIMPIHQLLRMGRGAVIDLDTTEKDDLLVLANNHPIAKASVSVKDGRVSIAITEVFRRISEQRAAA